MMIQIHTREVFGMENIKAEEKKHRFYEWLDLVVKDIQESCNEFNTPMVSLGAGIAIGVIIKHIDELIKSED